MGPCLKNGESNALHQVPNLLLGNSLFIHLATEEHDASGSDELIINSIMNKAAIDSHVLLSM